MEPGIKKLLTEGLAKGYAGQGKVSNIQRAFLEGKASYSGNSDGGIYYDEWFVPSRLGGGQEIVRVGNSMYTRLYGGGTPSIEVLSELGITSKDVSIYLKRKIIELGDQTRLLENCEPEPNGDWRYSYKKLEDDPNIPVIAAVESIYFKKVRVHIHPFILSPIE